MFCVVVLWVVGNAAKKPGLLAKWSMLGRKRPCCRMLLMLPSGPVWPALMCTISGVVEVARVVGSCGLPSGQGWEW